MSKHTPGPWKFQGGASWVTTSAENSKHNLWCGSVYPVSDTYIGEIAVIQSCDHIKGISRDEAEANARLTAAAPDLLAALEELLSYDRIVRPAFRNRPVGSPDSTARIDQDKLIALEDAARAAIAKAKGE